MLRHNDMGVAYVGGGWYFDVGVHTPLQTMDIDRSFGLYGWFEAKNYEE